MKTVSPQFAKWYLMAAGVFFPVYVISIASHSAKVGKGITALLVMGGLLVGAALSATAIAAIEKQSTETTA